MGKDESGYFYDSVPEILISVTGCSIICERQICLIKYQLEEKLNSIKTASPNSYKKYRIF
jgi:hypothetical protein